MVLGRGRRLLGAKSDADSPRRATRGRGRLCTRPPGLSPHFERNARRIVKCAKALFFDSCRGKPAAGRVQWGVGNIGSVPRGRSTQQVCHEMDLSALDHGFDRGRNLADRAAGRGTELPTERLQAIRKARHPTRKPRCAARKRLCPVIRTGGRRAISADWSPDYDAWYLNDIRRRAEIGRQIDLESDMYWRWSGVSSYYPGVFEAWPMVPGGIWGWPSAISPPTVSGTRMAPQFDPEFQTPPPVPQRPAVSPSSEELPAPSPDSSPTSQGASARHARQVAGPRGF